MPSTRYVAFLRAINVGGNAIINMADLKKLFEAAMRMETGATCRMIEL